MGGRPGKEDEGWRRTRRWRSRGRRSRIRSHKRDEGGGRERSLRKEVERSGRGRRMGGQAEEGARGMEEVEEEQEQEP